MRSIPPIGVAAALVLLLLVASAGPLPLTSSREIDLGENPNRAVVADLNGDGIPDVARTDHDGNGIFVCLNRGDATFSVLPRVAEEMWVWAIVARDLDGDGAAELVVSGILPDPDTGPISVIGPDMTALVLFENDGAGSLTARVLARRCEYRTAACLTDLDGDGDVDIAYERYSYDQPPFAGVLFDDGTGTFVPGGEVDSWLLRSAQAIFGGQVVDGDPEMDIFGYYLLDITGDGINDRVSPRAAVIVGRGDGTYGSFRKYGDDFLSDDGPSELADLDGDGDLDLVTRSIDMHVSVLLNEGAGVFARNHEYRLGGDDLGYLREIEAGDFDADGRTDILVIGSEGSRLLTLDGETPPTLSGISPGHVPCGTRQLIEVRGTDFAPETILDFGPGNSVVDIEFVSPESLLATVDVGLVGYENPDSNGFQGNDVIAESPSGGSSRILGRFKVDSYWDGELLLRKGRLVDSGRGGRDRFLVKGVCTWDLLEQAGSDLLLVFGGPLDPYELAVPGNDPGWQVHEIFDWTTQTSYVTGLTWRSPAGATPRVSFDFVPDPKQKKPWNLRISVRGFDFPGPQSKNVRLELHFGEMRLAAAAQWKKAGRGRFRARRKK